MAKKAGIYRNFNGKRFTAERGFSKKADAKAFAERLRKQGAKVRIVPADSHAKEAHDINWEVFVR